MVIFLFILLYCTVWIFLSVRNSTSLTLFREQLPMFPIIDPPNVLEYLLQNHMKMIKCSKFIRYWIFMQSCVVYTMYIEFSVPCLILINFFTYLETKMPLSYDGLLMARNISIFSSKPSCKDILADEISSVPAHRLSN